MDTLFSSPLAAGILLTLALLASGLALWFFLRWQSARGRVRDLELELAHTHTLLSEREDSRATLRETFQALSGEVLAQSQRNFLTLAKGEFDLHNQAASHTLEKREQAFKNFVEPIKSGLSKLTESAQGLDMRLKEMGDITQLARQETRSLANALRSPTHGGRWGEMHLQRVLELAGLSEHASYDFQSTSTSGRPDLVVRMPGGRAIAVDAKTPFDAYDAYLNAQNPQDEERHLKSLINNVRERQRELSKKDYWQGLDQPLEMTVLYLPFDGLYMTVLRHDPDLLERGVRERVLFATPTTLIGILRAVEIGWRQTGFIQQVRDIVAKGTDLHDRLAVMTRHLHKLGNQLTSSTQAYNDTVGSLEHNVLPAARGYEDLAKKEMSNLAEIQEPVRLPKAGGSDDVPVTK